MALGWPTSAANISAMEPSGPAGRLVTVGFPLFGASVLASFASLFRRYRGATVEVRHQLRWAIVGLGSAAIAFPFLIVPAVLGVWSVEVVNIGTMFMAPMVVGGFGIAILKHRLYDIDVVLNRALVFSALGLFITVVYVSIVVGVGQLVGQGDDPDLALSLLATAVVAVAFQPLRRRVQHWANVVVYGTRATPYEVLSRFSHTSASADHDHLLADAADLLAAASGAAVTVWVRQHDELVPVASSPDGFDVSAPLPVSGDAAADPRADLTVPVHGGDRLLGAISVAKPASEPLTDEERALVGQLAGAMGLLLRNRALTAELAGTVEELARSRDRIVAASDEARRMIDRNLRSQPLELLDTLGVELARLAGDVRTDAATRTAAILAQTAEDARHAAATVRELASGAYPAQLEAEGLAPALRARASTAPFPVALHAAGCGRYPSAVETAVYFSVLEALQNATKYAEPSSVTIVLEDRGGELTFEVADDGVGFTPDRVRRGAGLRNLEDRLDALGGTLTIESAPGRGARVHGVVPLRTAVGPQLASA